MTEAENRSTSWQPDECPILVSPFRRRHGRNYFCTTFSGSHEQVPVPVFQRPFVGPLLIRHVVQGSPTEESAELATAFIAVALDYLSQSVETKVMTLATGTFQSLVPNSANGNNFLSLPHSLFLWNGISRRTCRVEVDFLLSPFSLTRSILLDPSQPSSQEISASALSLMAATPSGTQRALSCFTESA